jgi:hypothetical protein
MLQVGVADVDEATEEANMDSFFVSFFEPQCGQGVPCHWLECTSNSKSLSHSRQVNS